MKCIVILFEEYETLDVFGPVEILGRLPESFEISFHSEKGTVVRSSQGVEVLTRPFPQSLDSDSILLLPGGMGTRTLVNNQKFLSTIKDLAQSAAYVLCVCTGSALLAKTGLLNGRSATTNKMAFDWVVSQNDKVSWQKQARWVVDGKYYTSSGVSAGMDMSLGFVRDMMDQSIAELVANQIEYLWNQDKNQDPFGV